MIRQFVQVALWMLLFAALFALLETPAPAT